jgi:hypothetical protein
MMRKLLFVFVAAVLFSCISFLSHAEEPAGKVIAYYFHGSFRCPTCHKLEEYSKEAIETNFKDAVASGSVEFREVNLEDKGNEHFAQDYQLYTKSLILSSVKDGKEITWKNLDKIWDLVGDKQQFIGYVTTETSGFIKGAQ